MAGEHAFKVEGRVIDVLPNGTYRLELSNGHGLLGFVTGAARRLPRLTIGIIVKIELSPFDLSEGRIILEEPKR